MVLYKFVFVLYLYEILMVRSWVLLDVLWWVEKSTGKTQTLHSRPDVGKDDDVLTITLVNIHIRLTKASGQIYEMCRFHAPAIKWTNSTIRVLWPLNDDPNAHNTHTHAVDNRRILLEQSFTACTRLLTVTSRDALIKHWCHLSPYHINNDHKSDKKSAADK